MISLTNSQIGELVGQFLLAGTGTLSFAILFACPRRSLPTCALVGAVGWFVYELCVMLGLDTAAASLLAVIPLTILTRVFAILQKTPVTVFLLSGIFPLVPGAGIYYTAYYFIQGDNALALSNGISTFKVAVALPWASRWCSASRCRRAIAPADGRPNFLPKNFVVGVDKSAGVVYYKCNITKMAVKRRVGLRIDPYQKARAMEKGRKQEAENGLGAVWARRRSAKSATGCARYSVRL